MLHKTLLAVIACLALGACQERTQSSSAPTTASQVLEAMSTSSPAQTDQASINVTATYLASQNDGRFTVTLKSDNGQCEYLVNGAVLAAGVEFNPILAEYCGTTVRQIKAKVIPRHAKKSPDQCTQTDDSARTLCYTEVASSNSQLALSVSQ